MITTKKILVRGKVQGVFFRQSTLLQADAIGITGTVKNLEDSYTVEIIATGNDAQLVKLIEWCKHGPPKSEVTDVEIVEIPLQEFENFSIL